MTQYPVMNIKMPPVSFAKYRKTAVEIHDDISIFFKVCIFPKSVSFFVNAAQESGAAPKMLPFLEAIFFSFIEQVSFRRPKVDNLGAPISVLLLNGALLAVIGVRYSWTSTDHTPVNKMSEVLLANCVVKNASPSKASPRCQ